MKVTCRQCGIEFKKEVRRQRKEGRDYFFAGVVVLDFLLFLVFINEHYYYGS